MSGIISDDIARLLARPPSLWEPLRGASLFISGGTGFFGIWLLEAILAANRERSLDCRVAVLSRDPARFAGKAPHLAADPADRTPHILHQEVQRQRARVERVPAREVRRVRAGPMRRGPVVDI
jgi:hypothetical protein